MHHQAELDVLEPLELFEDGRVDLALQGRAPRGKVLARRQSDGDRRDKDHRKDADAADILD